MDRGGKPSPLVAGSLAWGLTITLVGIAVAAGLANMIESWSSPAAEPLTVRHRKFDLDPRIKFALIRPADDVGKAGTVRGVMGWRFFEIPAATSGPSPNQLRFKFAAPAEVLQIDISADISDPRANLVEFAAAINSEDGYGLDRRADWLMHVSWTRVAGAAFAALDETTRLPPGVEVGAGDFVGISAWLGGSGSGDPIRVSPEVVVLYRWLT